MQIPLQAILYTRVSTGEQAEHGTSLDGQEAACLRKAREMNAQVVDVCSDPGVSGARYLTRPGIQSALAAIEAGRANLLIVAKLDRSGRDVDALRDIKKRVELAGGSLVFADGMNFQNNATGKLLFTQLAGFAEYERELIVERTTAGRRRRAEEGVQPCRTMHPYGYHIVTKSEVLTGHYQAAQLGKYIIVEAEAQWVREMFARYAGGESLADVCRWLQEQGVKTPREGAYWRKSTLKRILENPVYKGHAPFGRHERKNDESRTQQGFKQTFTLRKREGGAQVFIDAPALVSAEAWETCQARLSGNRATLGGNPTRKHRLTGLLVCPLCARGMRGYRRERTAKNGPRHEHYYHCPDQRPSRNAGGVVCNPALYNAQEAEDVVSEALERLVNEPEMMASELRGFALRLREQTTEDGTEWLRAELAELDAEEKATVKAQIAGIGQGVNPAFYAQAFAELAARRASLAARLNAQEANRSPAPDFAPQAAADKIQAVIQSVSLALSATEDEISEAEKHDWLALVIERIRPEGETWEITLRPLVTAEGTVAKISRLCPPAAATSRARLTWAWPLTSIKFSVPGIKLSSNVCMILLYYLACRTY